MPVLKKNRVSRVDSNSAWLNRHEGNVRSQFGEDGVLEKIFSVIGEDSRWCVEFGAWDGEHLSNTWNLLNNKGWSGVLIEGDPERAKALEEKYRSHAGRIKTLNAFVGWEGTNTLDKILAKTPIKTQFDLLSVDIDGNDWHVWRALTAYRPRVVVIEFNPVIPNDIVFVQDADAGINQGCSLAALIELGKSKGYELVAATLCNGFFVKKEEFPKFKIENNDIDAMYDCRLDMTVFHGYDGTVFGAGHMYLNWHNAPITQEDIQLLPKSLRVFPG